MVKLRLTVNVIKHQFLIDATMVTMYTFYSLNNVLFIYFFHIHVILCYHCLKFNTLRSIKCMYFVSVHKI